MLMNAVVVRNTKKCKAFTGGHSRGCGFVPGKRKMVERVTGVGLNVLDFV